MHLSWYTTLALALYATELSAALRMSVRPSARRQNSDRVASHSSPGQQELVKGRNTFDFEKKALRQVNKWWEPFIDALPGSNLEPGEEPYADEYWADPRIHSFGNMGPGGVFHALVAPIFTKGLDMFAYNDTDFRTLACLNVAAERAEAGLCTERIVDIGCGVGASTRALVNVWPDAEVHGMDTSNEMLTMARALSKGKGSVTYSNGNAEFTELPSHDYDVVSLMFLLHEAPQAGRKSILAEARRLLKPGGTLMICDIAREYEPSATMRSGEPYIDGYLLNVESDILSAGFGEVSVSQPIPGRAEQWVCTVPTLEQKNRYRRMQKPLVNALGVSFQLSIFLSVMEGLDYVAQLPEELLASTIMLP